MVASGGDGEQHEEVPQPAGAQHPEDGARAHLPRLPEVAQRAYDATMFPHILQHMCDDTDHGWLQLRNLQNTLPISRFKACL